LNRVSIDRSKRLFSALLGLPFANQRGRLWAGLIESRAGAQVDYGLVEQRLWLSLEAFDFNRELDRDPHLRASLRWDVTPNVYLRGGYDDFLVRDYESFFVGAGVRWTDRDLKYLLGSVPKF
jgi:phospholipid/cholesterol/gamma-HCH transport system substrate-binding protein